MLGTVCIGDRKMVTSTLAVKDTKAKRDSDFLQCWIDNVLKEYNIDKENVISIVTDNASDTVKTIEKLNESQETETNKTTDKDAKGVSASKTKGDQQHLDKNLDAAAKEASKLCKTTHILQLTIKDGL